MTRAQARRIAAEIRTTAAARPQIPRRCIDTGPVVTVVFVDAWGDTSRWVDRRCTGEYAGPTGYWVPSPAAKATLASLLSD